MTARGRSRRPSPPAQAAMPRSGATGLHAEREPRLEPPRCAWDRWAVAPGVAVPTGRTTPSIFADGSGGETSRASRIDCRYACDCQPPRQGFPFSPSGSRRPRPSRSPFLLGALFCALFARLAGRRRALDCGLRAGGEGPPGPSRDRGSRTYSRARGEGAARGAAVSVRLRRVRLAGLQAPVGVVARPPMEPARAGPIGRGGAPLPRALPGWGRRRWSTLAVSPGAIGAPPEDSPAALVSAASTMVDRSGRPRCSARAGFLGSRGRRAPRAGAAGRSWADPAEGAGHSAGRSRTRT